MSRAATWRTVTMQVWDLRSKRSVQTLQDSYQLLSVCFGDAGDTVYSAGIENTVKVHSPRRACYCNSMFVIVRVFVLFCASGLQCAVVNGPWD